MNLHDFQLIIINISGGKDSSCAIWQMVHMANSQGYPLSNMVISHQDLSDSEWPGTTELVKKQASFFGLKLYISRRRNKDGREETLLEYVKRRKKWPSNNQRYCTSDFKRAPGNRIVTQLTKDITGNVLQVFGFRMDESPARKKKDKIAPNKSLTTRKRKVFDYLPIHEWSTEKVWMTIYHHKIPYHYAYDLGMPRLSCVFCIFSPLEALIIAAKANPELFKKHLAVEREINHTFRENFSLLKVKEAIDNNQIPTKINDWRM